MTQIDVIVYFSAATFWILSVSHGYHSKPSVVISHGLSWLASHKDCKPAIWDSKPQLGVYN